jgi:hypothetical protein
VGSIVGPFFVLGAVDSFGRTEPLRIGLVLGAQTVLLVQPDAGQATALGVYVAAAVIVSRVGWYPVPVMGYGASPIVGAYVALALASVASAWEGHGAAARWRDTV